LHTLFTLELLPLTLEDTWQGDAYLKTCPGSLKLPNKELKPPFFVQLKINWINKMDFTTGKVSFLVSPQKNKLI